MAVDVLSGEGAVLLLPELTLVAGILVMLVSTNLGGSRIRIPLTTIRLPSLLGGRRFKWNSDPRLPGLISVFTLVLAIAMLLRTLGAETTLLTTSGNNPAELLRIDAFSRLFELIFLGALLLVSAASVSRVPADPKPSIDDLDQLLDNRRQVDLHLLLLISGLGMTIVAMSMNLFMLFIGLELASLAIYVLVAFHKETKAGSEAGVKYFIVGAVSSAVGLYGMSLLYLWSGTLQVDELAVVWSAMESVEALPMVGLAMLLVGFAFKVSAVPFHFATPDAYAGASSPVAALLASASKALGFVGLMRVLFILTLPGSGEGAAWMVALALLSVVTMTWGNIAALSSTNPKRMLAYSSVAHAGYMLAALVAVGAWRSIGVENTGMPIDAMELTIAAVIFHLFVLLTFKVGAFLVLAHLETEGDTNDLSCLNGLARREPAIAVSMFIFMLALAGVPPLAGFMSKFLMVSGIAQAASSDIISDAGRGLIPTISGLHWSFFLALAIFLNSALSVFYYLRVGVVMFLEEPDTRLPLPRAGALRLTIFVCAFGAVFFGINADWLINAAADAAAALLANA